MKWKSSWRLRSLCDSTSRTPRSLFVSTRWKSSWTTRSLNFACFDLCFSQRSSCTSITPLTSTARKGSDVEVSSLKPQKSSLHFWWIKLSSSGEAKTFPFAFYLHARSRGVKGSQEKLIRARWGARGLGILKFFSPSPDCDRQVAEVS